MERVPAVVPWALVIVPTLVLGVASHRAAEPAAGIPARKLQAASARDGFVVLERAPLQRVVELARDGTPADITHLPRLPTDARAVALRNGQTALLHQVHRRIQLDVIDDDGELAKAGEFGSRVHGFCDGVASNEHRFGVAWTESDGAVWFVHGPLQPGAATADAIRASDVEATGQPSYCAIAAAGTHLVLLWQRGQQVTTNVCNARRCTRAVSWRTHGRVQAVGCTDAGTCGVVVRGSDGTTDLQWIGKNGKPKWKQRLGDVATGSELSLAGAAAEHVVVGYMTGAGTARLVAADEGGRIQPVWTGESDAAPWLVWSRDRLLFARQVGGALAVGILQKRANELALAPSRQER